VTGLPTIRVAGRVDLAWDSVSSLGAGGVLVGDPLDIRWLTGFTGSAAVLVVAPRSTLVVDGRYADQAHDQLAAAACDADVVVAPQGVTIDEVAARMVVGAVGVDPSTTTLDRARRWRESCGATLVEIPSFARARMVKSPEELVRIEAAATATDRALAAAPVTVGQSEIALRNRIEREVRSAGADGPAFDTIVASGPHTAIPHHRPTERQIREGDVVLVDAGANVDGYRSDMTRTTFVGAVNPQLAHWWLVVSEAHAAGVAAVGPGATGGDVDRAVRAVFARHGVEEWCVHGTGHGVGLAIHEAPWLRRGSEDVLAPDMVVTVEPGLYRKDLGGVRIEDLLVVTARASRYLTHTPKDPPCPPSAPTT